MALVLLLECLGVSKRLNAGVVVIDVAFTVDHSDHFLSFVPGDRLMIDSRSDELVDTRIIVAVLAPLTRLAIDNSG